VEDVKPENKEEKLDAYPNRQVLIRWSNQRRRRAPARRDLGGLGISMPLGVDAPKPGPESAAVREPFSADAKEE
jgi:hypothetical protein